MKNNKVGKERHLIIGAGEVGRALFDLLNPKFNVEMRDVGGHKKEHFDIIHITYPPIKNFAGVTRKYIKFYMPNVVIIHSTIAVGTTRKIGPLAVHSPIFGPHKRGHNPGIVDGKTFAPSAKGKLTFGKNITYFVKYFSGPKADKAASYFSRIGIKTRIFKKPETTELLKILDTTYYAWNVVFSKEVKRLCDEYGLDFDEVYTIPNRDYNEGYRRIGKMSHVIRPVLKYMPGKIGGHCMIPNCDLLDDWLTKTIKERNRKY